MSATNGLARASSSPRQASGHPDHCTWRLWSAYSALANRSDRRQAVSTHNAIVSIMGHNGRVIAHSRDPGKWLGRSATGPLQQRALAGRLGFEPSVTLDNIPSPTYLSKPNCYRWYAVAGMPVAPLNTKALKSAIDAVSMSSWREPALWEHCMLPEHRQFISLAMSRMSGMSNMRAASRSSRVVSPRSRAL